MSQIRALKTRKHKQKQDEQLVISIDIEFYVFETRKVKEIKENYKIHVIFAYYYNENKKTTLLSFIEEQLKQNESAKLFQNYPELISQP